MDEEEKAAENDHPSRMASTSLIKSELEDFPLESRLDLGVGVGQNAAFVKNENEIDSEEVTLNFKSKGPFIYFQRDSIILNNLSNVIESSTFAIHSLWCTMCCFLCCNIATYANTSRHIYIYQQIGDPNYVV